MLAGQFTSQTIEPMVLFEPTRCIFLQGVKKKIQN